jgi:hypothetical protein
MNLWGPDDVSRILASAEDTLSSFRAALPTLDPEAANAYHLGFLHALQAVAVAFGLREPAAHPRTPARGTTPSWSIMDHPFLEARPANGQRRDSGRHNL